MLYDFIKHNHTLSLRYPCLNQIESTILIDQSKRFRSNFRHPITDMAVIIILFGNLKNIIIYNQGDKQEENDLTDICAWFKRLLCCWYYNVLQVHYFACVRREGVNHLRPILLYPRFYYLYQSWLCNGLKVNNVNGGF